MIRSADLENRAVTSRTLTERQLEVLQLARGYYAVAREWPSSGWISRRLRISRATAHEHLAIVREKTGLVDP